MTFQGRPNRWDAPPPNWPDSWVNTFQAMQPHHNNRTWLNTGTANKRPTRTPTPPPPGTEDGSNQEPRKDRRYNTGRNDRYERGHRPSGHHPSGSYYGSPPERWRKPTNYRRPYYPSNDGRRDSHRYPHYRPTYDRQDRNSTWSLEDHVVLSENDAEKEKNLTSEPGTIQIVPGSEEERKRNLQDKINWLKKEMEKKTLNKDFSEEEKFLLEKKKTALSIKENTQKNKYCLATTEESALKETSVEKVKENLSNLSSVTENVVFNEDKTRQVEKTRLARLITKQIPRPSESPYRGATEDRSRKTEVRFGSKPIQRGASSNRTSERPKEDASRETEGMFEQGKAPALKNRTMANFTSYKQSVPSTEAGVKRTNLWACVSKLCGVSNLGQLKYLLNNPKPGKFEFYLKEQIRKHRLMSCRAVRLSGEPLSDTQPIDSGKTESPIKEDVISNLENWDCSVHMNDLPFELVQELGKMLEVDFASSMDAEPMMESVENPPTNSTTTELLPPSSPNFAEHLPPVTPTETSTSVQPTTFKPGIRIRDFARIDIEPTIPQGENETAKSKNSPDSAMEADTTIVAPHPLDGPNLMAAVKAVTAPDAVTGSEAVTAATVLSQTASISPSAKNIAPNQKGPPYVRLRRILPQDIFHSGGDCGKKSLKSPNRPKPSETRVPDSTVPAVLQPEINSEKSPAPKVPSKEEKDRRKSKKKQTSVDVSLTDSSIQEEETSSSKPLTEPQILARLQEIYTEISSLNNKVATLEKERESLYALLPLAKENLKRKRKTSESPDNESIQEIMAGVCADLLSTPSMSDQQVSPGKKKKTTKKRYSSTSSLGKQVEPRSQLPAPVTDPSPGNQEAKIQKGSLRYFKQNLTFTCDKNMLPKDYGIITQIKVIRKSVLAASDDGNIYSFSSTTGKCRKTFTGEGSPVKCFVLGETNVMPMLIFGSEDGHLFCYTLISGRKINVLPLTNEIQCLDSRWGSVYIGTKCGSILKYDIATNVKASNPVISENGEIFGLQCTTEGPRRVLIVASKTYGIQLMSAKDGMLLRDIVLGWDNPLRERALLDLKFAVDVNINRVCYSKPGQIIITEFSNPEAKAPFRGVLSTIVSCLCIFKEILYVGCKDGSIRRFHLQTNQQLEPLTGNRENVVCMDVIDDKIILARKGGVFDLIHLKKSSEDTDSDEE